MTPLNWLRKWVKKCKYNCNFILIIYYLLSTFSKSLSTLDKCNEILLALMISVWYLISNQYLLTWLHDWRSHKYHLNIPVLGLLTCVIAVLTVYCNWSGAGPGRVCTLLLAAGHMSWPAQLVTKHSASSSGRSCCSANNLLLTMSIKFLRLITSWPAPVQQQQHNSTSN